MSDPRDSYARAVDAINAGRWADASVIAQQLAQHFPNHAGVHFISGVAAIELGQVGAALAHLRRAASLNPSRPDYLAQLARVLLMASAYREAHAAADAALSLSPQDPLTLDTLGVVYSRLNAHGHAAAVFRMASEQMPEIASYRFNLATSLTFAGDIAAAEIEYEACLAIDPHYWQAHLALSQARRQTASSNHISRLRGLLQAKCSDPQSLLYVNLALAKEEEDLGHYDEAFALLVAGKSSYGATRGYRPESDAALVDSIIAAMPEVVESRAGDPSRAPIFIVGMPRSGTTLVERILSSHSQVYSAGELQNFSAALKRASGSRTRHLLDVDTLQRSANVDWFALGRAYLESTLPATDALPRFVDKLPHNFLLAGFIAKALPRAKIICLRRNPVDTCLSNFRQLFALSSPYYDYSFDLLDTGRYYLQFDRLMKHWHQVLPGRVMSVAYEDVVDAQEEITRKLLEFCDLGFEPACLRFEHNPAPVATASAIQVREGISRKYMDRWRHYGTHLHPLRKLLAEGGIDIAKD